MRFRRQWQFCTILVLAAIAYLPALHNGPIEDDLPLLYLRLGGVQGWGDLPPLLAQSYWGAIHDGGLWRPLTLVTLGAQKLLFGDRLWAFRCISLALHAINSAFVLMLARALFRTSVAEVEPDDGVAAFQKHASVIAFLVAGLFAVHPIHAEAVITIYGQADLWAALFALAAVVWLVCRSGEAFLWRRTIGISVLFLLSLGFKESAVLLPVAIWLLGWQMNRRARVGLALTLAAYIMARVAVLGPNWTPPDAVGGAGLGARFVAVCVAVATDLRLMVLPWGQTIYYGHLRDRLIAGGSVEVIGLVLAFWGGLWAWRSTGRGGRAGLILLIVFLLPVAGIVPIGTLVAERTLYLPSIGLLLLAGAILMFLSAGDHRTKRVWVMSGAVALLIGMTLSWHMTQEWRDERAAWENTLADHPRSARAAAEVVRLRLDDPNFAATPAARGELHGLIEKARAINPESPRVFEVMAKLAASEGDAADAVEFEAMAKRLSSRQP
ncbi:MAG: hypothetical protein JWM57_633 [Phycisphaerales bacterium]|nr:hypothetical protein [Phycisphaerales bacterium]